MVDLCIAGGNFKGLALLGSLEYLHSMNYLTHVENFYGCSVGSIIGIFYLIGNSPRELLTELLNMDLGEYWDFDIQRVQKEYSVVSSKIFSKFKSIFSKKENPLITIKEFNEKYSTKINIIVTCLTTKESVFFNGEKYPEIQLFDAITASCSIPFVFPPVKINDLYYVDGSVRCWSGCPNFKIRGYIIKLQTLPPLELDCFSNYANEVLLSMVQNEVPEESKNVIIVTLPEEFNTKVNFNDINNATKTKLFYYGLKAAQEKLTDLLDTNPDTNPDTDPNTDPDTNTEIDTKDEID